MGRVYRAQDTLLRRQVAIKYLSPNANQLAETNGDSALHAPGAGASLALQRQLLHEARAMAGLRHESLCRVLEIIQDAREPFIVMEWIDGLDLRSAWAPLDQSARLALLLKITDAVAVLHAAGVTHRDLKPGNILVDARGLPVIVDFGLATHGIAGLAGGGTPGYAAPEQFQAGAMVGPTADVFALGVLLYELLTNQSPFSGRTAEEIVEATNSKHPALPETIAPDAPSGLQRICLAALERDPKRRYPSAKELADDLRRFIRGEIVAARPSILAEHFHQIIDEQIIRTRQWERHALITAEEARHLQRTLMALQRPDSPWIIDSRRLTTSQVGLYLGGWIALAAIAVGFARSWDSLSPLLKLAVPASFTLTLVLLGIWLQARDHRRVSLAYLITACIALPVTAAIFFKQSHWLSNGGEGMGTAELFARVRETAPNVWAASLNPEQGIFNLQLFFAALLWLAACIAGRAFTRSGAFTFIGSLAAYLTWALLWLVCGGLSPARDAQDFASVSAHMLMLTGIAFAAGCLLCNAEQAQQASIGMHRVRRSDAWPVLTLGVVGSLVSLTAIAIFKPTWYLLPQLISDSSPSITRIALAFMLNGCGLLVASAILTRRLAPARESLAVFLRWILPSHFMAPLLLLHSHDVWELHDLWLSLGALGALALCFISVWKQWKPFLVNGLVYLAIVYFRAFDEPIFSNDLGRAILALGALTIGIAAMILAWKLPAWVATARLQRWLQQAKSTAAQSVSASRRDTTY